MKHTRSAVSAEDLESRGSEMYELIAELYPICRSLTGDGVRRTLEILKRHVDLEVREVATGTRVFDWAVPREWNIRDAYVKNSRGERVIDFRDSNLHVVGYSTPVSARMSLTELKPHLHSLPEHPDWIPYRTSYYADRWGFCLAHHRLLELPEEEYEVVIDASLEDGHLTWGELFLPGESDEEVLIHTHVCHPSLANDNLSGIAVATWLARELKQRPRRYGVRFLFLPGTLGAIAWLALHEEKLGAIRHGLVLSNLGDPGGMTYKKSRRGDATVDRAAAHVLSRRPGHRIVDFAPYGYDERQYCSPGIDLPVGSLARSSWGTFPEYHTSADDLDLVRPEHLADSLAACLEILDVLEGDRRYRNLNPKCEPQLGRRGLYGTLGGGAGGADRQHDLLWVLSLSDSEHSLLDIAERAGVSFARVRRAAEALEAAELLEEIRPGWKGRGLG